MPGKGETPLNEECFLPYAYAPGVPFPKEKERLIFLLPPLYYTPEKKTTEKVTIFKNIFVHFSQKRDLLVFWETEKENRVRTPFIFLKKGKKYWKFKKMEKNP